MVEFGSRNVYPTDPLDVWGNVKSIGNAELAARLWSINTYDRRGNIVFMDNFEEPVLKWEPITHGDGSSVALSTLYSRSAGNSLKLAVGTGAAFYAGAYKYVPLPIENKLGIEASFTIPDDIDRLGITFVLYDGTVAHRTELYYSRTSDLLYIAGVGVPYTVDTDISPLAKDYLFHTMKFVIDYSARRYVRVLFDDKEYDVSDVEYGITLPPGDITGTAARIGLWAWNDAVGTPVVYADDVICTQNEPINKAM